MNHFYHSGNASLKNRTFTDTNDASFDSSYSAYLQETKSQLAKSTQPPLNLSQSLSNIVDVSALSLAKEKYFEKPTMVSTYSLCVFLTLFYCIFTDDTLYPFLFIHTHTQTYTQSSLFISQQCKIFFILICVFIIGLFKPIKYLFQRTMRRMKLKNSVPNSNLPE